MSLAGCNLLSAAQLDRADLDAVCALAARLAPLAAGKQRCDALRGALLTNLFMEPSTRTRLSFASAFCRLGGALLDMGAAEATSLAKGESMADTVRVLSGQTDIICMRLPDAGAVEQLAASSRVPVINGGDGSNEHPTQALLDIYSLQAELGAPPDGLRLALVGDLRYGRTVHSLCRLLCLYKNLDLRLVAPDELQLPPRLQQQLRDCGASLSLHSELESGLDGAQAIYSTRIQTERLRADLLADPEGFSAWTPYQSSPDAVAASYSRAMRLHRELHGKCAPDAVILHPLPRGPELATDLDEHPKMAAFRQADNGVAVRMALFLLIMGREDML